MSASLRFLVSTVLNKRNHGAPSRGGAKEMTMSSCICEPLETAQSLGDDTHAVVTRLKEHQSTHRTVCGSWRRWVESLAHPMQTNRHKTARREEETVRQSDNRAQNEIISTSTT